jgi:MSHA biogenesis protein MshI
VITIDISELCLRNITALLQQNLGDSVGLLMLGQGRGLINLTEGRNLYLSRKIEMDVIDLAGFTNRADPMVESLALEAQRSFDYYESQLGKGVVTQLMVAPASVEIGGVVKLLDEMLQAKVCCIDLGSQLDVSRFSLFAQAKCFTAIGAALRSKAA